MRQAITVISLLGSFMVFALTIDLFDSLFMFVLFGVVPGRAEPIAANQMLSIYAASTIVVLLFSVRQQIIAVLRFARFSATRRSSAS